MKNFWGGLGVLVLACWGLSFGFSSVAQNSKKAGAKKVKGVREVDWMNYAYEVDGESVSVKNGEAKGKKGNPDYLLRIVKVEFEDITGDKSDEVLINYFETTGGNGGNYRVDIYTFNKRLDKISKLLEVPPDPKIEDGDVRLHSGSFFNDGVTLYRDLFVGPDGECCPSRTIVEKWQFDSKGPQWLKKGSSLVLENANLETSVTGGDLSARQDPYVVNLEGTITDSATGWVWAELDNGNAVTWDEAKKYCAGKGRNWSLPNDDQLKNLYDNGIAMQPPKDDLLGPQRQYPKEFKISGYYLYSSSVQVLSSPRYIDLYGGKVTNAPKDKKIYALCIRSE